MAVYLTTNDFKDPDIRDIITNDAIGDSYLDLAEDYFLNFITNIGGTAPDAGDETYNQKRLMIVYASEIICKDYMGLDYQEVQDGVLDKYAVKFSAYYKERTGTDWDTGTKIGKGLEDIVYEEIEAVTDPTVPTLDWNM